MIKSFISSSALISAITIVDLIDICFIPLCLFVFWLEFFVLFLRSGVLSTHHQAPQPCTDRHHRYPGSVKCPGKGNHVGQINAKRDSNIAHTAHSSSRSALSSLPVGPGSPYPAFIQFTDGINHLVEGHVLRSLSLLTKRKQLSAHRVQLVGRRQGDKLHPAFFLRNSDAYCFCINRFMVSVSDMVSSL